MASNLRRVLATCGNGDMGRLGHGVACLSEQYPRIVAALVGYGIKQVAAGGAHTVVVTDDGSLFTFGLNDKGQLGHSEKEKFVPVPIEVVLPHPVTHVAAGDYHTLALTSAGEVWAWGSHQSGQLGIGSQDDHVHKMPRLVKPLSGAGVAQLGAGAEHSMALSEDGRSLWTWGNGTTGALGLGSGAMRGVAESPQLVRGPLAGVRLLQLATGLFTSGAVDDAGRAWTWGVGNGWQLGHGTNASQHVPKQVDGLTNVAALAMGYQSSWALRRDGGLFCWGTDDCGSLGQGEGNWQKAPIRLPQEFRALPECKAISAGWKHMMAITWHGALHSWGWSGAYSTDGGGGQLGLGDGRDHWAPAQVGRIHTSKDRYYDLRMKFIKPWKAVQVSCGRNHSALLLQVDLDVRDLT